MIAKIVKGSSFKGVVSYILDKKKDAKILVCDGLFAENKDTIAMSFEAQSKMNPKVTKPVGHISLAFHKEDEHRLTDRAMVGIALEYLKEMGITYNGSIGLFMLDNTDGQAEENRFEEELKRRNKKKKQRKIRF